MSNRVPEFFDIDSIEVDGQNIIFNLNRANANMAGCLADPLFLIMDTSIDNSNIAMEGPVCTGPYAFQSFDPSGDTVVVRNEYYWDGDVPNDSVTLRIIGDQTTRSMALQSGEIDVAYNLKTETVFEFDGNGNLTQYEGGYTDYLEAKKQREGIKENETSSAPSSHKNTVGEEKSKKDSVKTWKQNRPTKLKFSFKEQREYETIDNDIAALEDKISALDHEIMANATNSGKLNELTQEKEQAEKDLEEKMDRWVYLNDLAEQIEALNKN